MKVKNAENSNIDKREKSTNFTSLDIWEKMDDICQICSELDEKMKHEDLPYLALRNAKGMMMSLNLFAIKRNSEIFGDIRYT